MSETIKLKPGEELVISVPKNARVNRGRGPGGKKKGGPLSQSSSRDKYLPRRKGGGLINFYDMGQIKTGMVFGDVEFFFVPGLVPAGDNLNISRSLELSDYTSQRDTQILSEDPSTWSNKFRRIVKSPNVSGKYKLTAEFRYDTTPVSGLLDTLSQWTSKGLVVTPSDIAAGISIAPGSGAPGCFEGISLGTGDTSLKITATSNYADDPVVFTASNKMDVYLMPTFCFSRGESEETFAGTPSTRKHYLNGFFINYPRVTFLNPSDPLFGFPSGGGDLEMPGYADTIRAITFNKGLSGAREMNYNDSSGTWTSGGLADFPGAVFTTPPTEPPTTGFPRVEPAGFEIGFNQIATDITLNGVLLAVVKKAGLFYYFWRNIV